MRIPFISILAAGTLALGGCAYGDYGYGAGYGGYGGYGSYYGDYGYGTPYSGYGYGYGGYDPFGWYGDYYYPGVGIYVFDRNRHRHVWNGDQQRYWSGRRTQWQSHTGRTSTNQNWSGFHHRDSDRSHHDRHH
jgi:hypothetical protein